MPKYMPIAEACCVITREQFYLNFDVSRNNYKSVKIVIVIFLMLY